MFHRPVRSLWSLFLADKMTDITQTNKEPFGTSNQIGYLLIVPQGITVGSIHTLLKKEIESNPNLVIGPFQVNSLADGYPVIPDTDPIPDFASIICSSGNLVTGKSETIQIIVVTDIRLDNILMGAGALAESICRGLETASSAITTFQVGYDSSILTELGEQQTFSIQDLIEKTVKSQLPDLLIESTVLFP